MPDYLKELITNPKSGIWGICVMLILFMGFQQYLFVDVLRDLDDSIKQNTHATTSLSMKLSTKD